MQFFLVQHILLKEHNSVQIDHFAMMKGGNFFVSCLAEVFSQSKASFNVVSSLLWFLRKQFLTKNIMNKIKRPLHKHLLNKNICIILEFTVPYNGSSTFHSFSTCTSNEEQ